MKIHRSLYVFDIIACTMLQNSTLRYGKSLRTAGSTINRTVSFRFLAFIYDPYNIRNFYIQSISIVCYKTVILFIYYDNGNARLNYEKPRLTLHIKIPSYFLLT